MHARSVQRPLVGGEALNDAVCGPGGSTGSDAPRYHAVEGLRARTIYRASGFSPAFVMTPAVSAEDRKRSSATAASGCCEFFGSVPTKKVGG